ncbi:MAG: hypothetical protein UU40_C0022G0005 [Candidatus Uhrbacteria bacterium GW2011_GWD2_41_121]|uniref:Uncharacterized protein n=1 Tax=Candidatus Uhrbacteria bacterium GW2011_GWC1_41_20 TaxID=1618983 RepID=A0A0G0XLW7_9BACT|nr:MAG: hypothetical protein UT52_C0024G0007 [Candidatus Uhrbacteria bacterium GW2011_GWE1_39_46]KKR63210.1 MAG: hypothetical protein UU04_C0023G0007 [Candidatus Uhrbacteria bacterium GW2011_GWC2_40_450]KKR89533.1 MAG: hypothetical protein UU40_C0022G0005 [Candidatus Uhrbacteria bacterium GW2011_GWD2_41_121]KKR94746.1 MAG: hypothetical protein UU46_C0030G0005 [Candidatus Uhrbacteria bacterium GW2011_GWD1_41_16]KKR97785.1 MAG: hypothetical protein UU50_C0024G0005 [Candidatus Uhrbacteria bacteriu
MNKKAFSPGTQARSGGGENSVTLEVYDGRASRVKARLYGCLDLEFPSPARFCGHCSTQLHDVRGRGHGDHDARGADRGAGHSLEDFLLAGVVHRADLGQDVGRVIRHLGGVLERIGVSNIVVVDAVAQLGELALDGDQVLDDPTEGLVAAVPVPD